MSTDSPAERRRQQFVAIASRLTAQEGINSVTPGRVAEEAQCTRPLVYRYFPSIDILFDEVITDFSTRVTAALESSGPIQHALDVFDVIVSSIDPEAIGPHGVAPLILQRRNEDRLQTSARSAWAAYLNDLGIPPSEAIVTIEAVAAVLNQLIVATTIQGLPMDRARQIFDSTVWGILGGVLGETATIQIRQDAKAALLAL